jgi:CubicO group peptidase (beta-lactamase class C family)
MLCKCWIYPLMLNLRNAVVAASLALGLAATAAATTPPTVAPAAVDGVFAAFGKSDGPGCAVGISRAGMLVFAKGYGMANLEHALPITPETVFPIGSNSKQFTATIVALLAAEGKIDLDADVRRYLPEFPVYPTTITARELVYHTGGLRDYQALRLLAGIPPEHVDPRQVLGLLLRQRAPQAPAGTRFAYDNSGYVILRFLAERVGAKSLPALAQERVFGPLGMTHTRWLEDFTTVVPHRATAYDGERTTGFRAAYSHPVVGSGGILTTVGDLARWQGNFYANEVGHGQALIQQLLTPGKLADGKPLLVSHPYGRSDGYAWGQFLDTWHGHRMVWHGGTGPGYVADLVRFPDDRLEVSVLCNGVINSHVLSRRVAALYLGESGAAVAAATAGVAVASPPPPPPLTGSPAAGSGPVARAGEESPPLAAATLHALVGSYRNPETGTIWNLAPNGGELLLDLGRLHMRLAPAESGALRSVDPDWGWRMTFESPISGTVPRLHLFEEGRETSHYQRLPAGLPPAALGAYAGLFMSDELTASYEIAAAADALHVRTPVQPNGPLLYLGGDSFVLPTEWFDIRFDFTRDGSGVIDGFTVDAGPASGIRFHRQRPCS